METSADAQNWHTDARYFYYPHGPLQRVELGDHLVQGTDYAYTLQGWLKGINGDRLNPLQAPQPSAYPNWHPNGWSGPNFTPPNAQP